MDQELKQRLIGAAIITALAVIFVPMLFDDPVDETGKDISSLKIPEPPEKAQAVEITPLPEKVEDATSTIPPLPTENSLKSSQPAVATIAPEEGVAELPNTKSHAPTTARETPATGKHPHSAIVEMTGDDGAPQEEYAPAAPPVPPTPAPKAAKLPAQSPVPATGVTAKPVKQIIKPVTDTAVPETAEKPSAGTPVGSDASARWYLNVGSFSQKNNALAQLESLKQQGFAASIKEITGEKGSMYKVRVGPILDKAKAQAVKNKLTQLNINSFFASDE